MEKNRGKCIGKVKREEGNGKEEWRGAKFKRKSRGY